MDSLSLSNSISKETKYENTELSTAYFEDLKGRGSDTISNERIQNGDRILETYEVTSDAIYGGMGSVWRVHHNSWNTDLAMKRPQPRFFAEGGDAKKAQFVDECEHWINLGLHPNIVSCYYVREISGVPTIFSEWMDGGSLSDRIKDGSLYEGTEDEIQERILDIAIQAARGLQYSHENGLIHQDFKPGNLLLTKEWDAKVADFGLAKAKSNLDEGSETAKTTGYTLAYCPQEQVDREEPQKWMDVYSWALTVLEMYAGKRLWQTGAEAKAYFEEYPAQCAHSIPDEMQNLLKGCLINEPDGFIEIADRLNKFYIFLTGHEYPRRNNKVTDSAGSLNNRALSFIDLGKFEQAEECWKKALELNRNSYESIFNRALSRWRRGEINVDEAIKELDDISDSDVCDEYEGALRKESHGKLTFHMEGFPEIEGMKIFGFSRDKSLAYGQIIEVYGEQPIKSAVIKGVVYNLKENKIIFSKNIIQVENQYDLKYIERIFVSYSDARNRIMVYDPQKMKWMVYSVESGELIIEFTGRIHPSIDMRKRHVMFTLSPDGNYAVGNEIVSEYYVKTLVINTNNGEETIYEDYRFHGFTLDGSMLLSSFVSGEKTETNGQLLFVA